MSAFHAYDIRGKYNIDFDKSDVYKIGFFLPVVLNAQKILVGRDARTTSFEINNSLISGMLDSGAEVYDAGLTTTPMIYWGTAKFSFDASVMITASHNPKEYNGLKVSRKQAMPVGYDSGLKIIEQKILDNDPITPNAKKGKCTEFNFKNEYLDFQRQYLNNLDNLNMVIDCSNGMAGLFIREILGNAPTYINEEPDGAFPGHDPNPLDLKNTIQLQKKVKEISSDVGVIFDGDADRVMFLDEKGEFISPDLIIALLGHFFLNGKNSGERVLQDIRSSKSVGEYLSGFNAIMHTWKVGRAFASPKLREIDGIYGGELAGHYYFRDFYYSDSGIMASLIILGILAEQKKKGNTFSQLIGRIKKYENSGEINFKIKDKQSAMDAVRNYFIKLEKPLNSYDLDGYRLEYNDWWFNIRASNTEPYLRLLVEGNTPDILMLKVQQIRTILEKFV